MHGWFFFVAKASVDVADREMKWSLIIFAVICVHDVIAVDVSLSTAEAQISTDDQKYVGIPTVGRPINDATPTDGSTGSDDVRCTIGDVIATRKSHCPAQCSCSPLDGQDVLTKLIVDCHGAQFNQSSQYLTRLLSRCASELTDLTITNNPSTTVLPEVVCKLSKIQSLNVNSNRLASLPRNCFTRMRNLTSFSACNNSLTTLQVG